MCVRVERGAVGWVVARSGSVELLHGARIMNSIIGPADGETEVHVRLQCRFWPTTKAVYATLEDLRNRQIAIAQVLFFPHILPMVACDPGLMTNP